MAKADALDAALLLDDLLRLARPRLGEGKLGLFGLVVGHALGAPAAALAGVDHEEGIRPVQAVLPRQVAGQDHDAVAGVFVGLLDLFIRTVHGVGAGDLVFQDLLRHGHRLEEAGILIFLRVPHGVEEADGVAQAVLLAGVVVQVEGLDEVFVDEPRLTLAHKAGPQHPPQHESIAELVKDKRIEGISDINDYSSDRAGMRMEIDLKRDANPQVILNQLYSYTQLQISYGIIQLAIVDGEPKILTLKQILEKYIDFQKEVIIRRTKFDLKKALEREHILEGLARAIDIVDEIIATIRACKGGQAEAKAAIMEKFDFDDVQAAAIVAFRLGQLAGLEIQKIHNEMEELQSKINYFNEILSSDEKVLSIVKDELSAIGNKFGDDRRTEIVNVSGEVDIEDLIPNENCVFTLTTLGYIKRQSVDTYQTQHRGGRGVKGMTRREEDVAETMFTCSTHDYIMFFTSEGKVYRLKGYEIPEGSRNSKGMNIVNILPLGADEKVTAMIRVPEFGTEKLYLCMLTKNGVIKRTELDAYKNVRKNGIFAINLDEGDELRFVKLTDGEKQILIATRKGMCISFNENDARCIGRTARGVKAITFSEGDEIAGMCVPEENKKVLTVSETGFGRRSEFDNYRVQSRGGKGLINYHTETYGDVAAVAMVGEDEDVIMISSDGIIIRIPAKDISVFARPSKGVRVMKTNEGEKVATLSITEHETEDESSESDAENDGEVPVTKENAEGEKAAEADESKENPTEIG